MKKLRESGQVIYSPHDLINFMESEFTCWMDRRYLEDPNNPDLQPDEDDESTKILQSKGLEHEEEFLVKLKAECLAVVEIPRLLDASEQTLTAINQGVPVIYQGMLRLGDFAGIADFLIRVDGKSALGNFEYEVWDTKLSRKPKPYFIIQLCCYAEMVEAIQGKLPTIGIVLGDKSVKKYRTDEFLHYYHSLKAAFQDWCQHFDSNKQPDVIEVDDFSRWRSHAEKILKNRDDLSRVANIRQTQIRKLKQHGINTMNGLATTTLERIPKIRTETFSSLKQQASLQVITENLELQIPKYDLLPLDKLDPRRGLASLPPGNPWDVWFDMEGYPHVDGGLEYLFGITYLDENKPAFIDWWAHSREDEKAAFEAFIDWIYDRWKKSTDVGMHIYHYASYEVSAMRRLMGRHATREEQVDELLRNGVFIDLYTVVKQSICVGTPSYSIKYIEHLYKPPRDGTVATATDSIVFYERWLEHKDGDTWENSEVLKSIRDYNKEDCDSTMGLTNWLRNLQQENKIEFVPISVQEDDDKDLDTHPAAQLAQQLLDAIPSDRSPDPERWRVHELLAWLLRYYKRERKPLWWQRFSWHDMTEQELIEDVDCLGALSRTTKAPEPIRKSMLYEYEFERQETKLQEKSKCLFAHDLDVTVEIEQLSREQQKLSFPVSIKSGLKPPSRLSLIPKEFTQSRPIAESIFEIVLEFEKTNYLPKAIEDFLFRRQPKIKGRQPGEPIIHTDDYLKESIAAVENLDESTLCIQGPPGSGKTYVAAHVILHLLAKGKRIGITASSHKAIDNLLNEVGEIALKEKVSFRAANKVFQGDEPTQFSNPNIQNVFKVQDAFTRQFNLIAGTAFAFSDNSAIGQVDYLFVDEAGQVSVANLLGMSRSTKNIVLLGDQMQLEQPTRGSHPGESSWSTLEYLLESHQTIPDYLGIFLAKTWRMHPHLCSIVSTAVYEGKLIPEKHTKDRVLTLPTVGAKWLTKEAGILFIPVEHEDNTRASNEEAERIQAIVDELLLCKVVPKEGNAARSLVLDDILIVAPYNLQVQNIKELLPNAKVASVDKFQGQEEAIVIVSMCASEASVSPRGIDFLFSRNRLNVAISRARTMAIVVGCERLARTRCSRIDQIALVDFYCRIIQASKKEILIPIAAT